MPVHDFCTNECHRMFAMNRNINWGVFVNYISTIRQLLARYLVFACARLMKLLNFLFVGEKCVPNLIRKIPHETIQITRQQPFTFFFSYCIAQCHWLVFAIGLHSYVGRHAEPKCHIFLLREFGAKVACDEMHEQLFFSQFICVRVPTRTRSWPTFTDI